MVWSKNLEKVPLFSATHTGIASGHIPNSLNIPFNKVLHDNQFKSDDELKLLFTEHGVDLDNPITLSCGSGVTACVLYMALEKAGARSISVYDGSWSEYAAIPGSVIDSKGPANE